MKSVTGFKNKISSRDVLVFTLLIPLIFIVQKIAYKYHLLYGFRDVDWMFIKDYQLLPPFSIKQLIVAWKQWGVYTYQMYYIGIQDQIFGINFLVFNRITQLFKFFSAISLFPLVLLVTKKRTSAFFATLLFSFSYATVGAMFSVVTSGNYLAILVMNLFHYFYYYTVKIKKGDWKYFIFTMFLFLSTMFLSTERMYPLIPFILFFEILNVYWNKKERVNVKKTLLRILIFISPIIAGYIFEPYAVTQFFRNTHMMFDKIGQGNWQLILTNFASLGSLYITPEYWRFFGSPDITTFGNYLDYLIKSPMILFTCLTITLSFVVERGKIRFILSTLLILFAASIAGFVLAGNVYKIDQSMRVHFDPSLIVPINVGLFILVLGYAFLRQWIINRQNIHYLMIFVGSWSSLLYIFLTWLASDNVLVFMGTQRYMTIPAIGMSLVIASISVLFYEKTRKIKFIKYFSVLVFLPILGFAIINIQAIEKFFYDEVFFAGMNGEEQTKMKQQVWDYVGDLSDIEPSLFYFDESTDVPNGYFHESAVIAGIWHWPLFDENGKVVKTRQAPRTIRTNLLCPETRRNCLDLVEPMIQVKDGEKGILFGDVFYLPDNFYAFRLNNKQVIDITDETKRYLGLE